VEKDGAKRLAECVALQADRDTRMRHVYAAIENLRGVAKHDFFRFAFHRGDSDALYGMEVPVRMPPPADSCWIVVDADGNTSFNGKGVPSGRLGGVLDRLARYSGNAVIAVHLHPDATVQRLIEILCLVDVSGFHKVYLVSEMRGTP